MWTVVLLPMSMDSTFFTVMYHNANRICTMNEGMNYIYYTGNTIIKELKGICPIF